MVFPKRTYCLWLGFALLTIATANAQQNVVVILDDSGSMNQRMGQVRRIDAAKSALEKVLGSLPQDTEVGVLALNTRDSNGSPWIVPMGKADPTRWQQSISKLRADGGTPLGQFTRTAADELLNIRRKNMYASLRLLVVTDGEATDGGLLESYVPRVLARGIVLDVIGVQMAGEHSLARLSHTYRRADDPQSLTQALTEVFAETSRDDQDAQSDFELLAGLPDGYAEAIIKSMNDVGTQPIDETPSESVPVGPTTSIPPNAVQQVPSIGGFFGGFVCCCGSGIVMLVIVINILTRAARRSS